MYILKRFLIMFLTIWVIASLTFVIMKFIPGDPFASDSKRIPEEVLKNQRDKYHLDEPIPIQYIMYMKDLVTLDLGTSIQSETRSVNSIIKQGAPVSALLGLQALVVALIFGLFIGIIAAHYHNRFLDYASMMFAILGISIPSFILAPFLIKFLAVDTGILPVASWGTWLHTVLPTIALAASPLAVIARFMRSSMLEVLNQDYIKTADSKGISRASLVFKHGVRNAILPVVSFLGPLLASLIAGTFIIEEIFAIPGIGRYYVDSIFNRDYPVIMGTTIFFSTILVVVLFLVDISYRFIDPRIKINSKEE